MCWSTTKRSWAAESICSITRMTSDSLQAIPSATPRFKVGDHCYIDMDLGQAPASRGSDLHRLNGNDFAKATIMLHAPNGRVYALKRQTIGGSSACFESQNESQARNGDIHIGASFFAWQPGVYIADARQMTDDSVTGKSIKCAKAIIGVAGHAGLENGLTGFERSVSQVLEIVPLNDPTNLVVGDSLAVQVLFKGAPLPCACLAVLPRGKVLPRFGVENPYDLLTDAEGKAQFTFEEANYHLLVVHLVMEGVPAPEGGSCQKLRYTGDLTVMVRPRHQELDRETFAQESLDEAQVTVLA